MTPLPPLRKLETLVKPELVPFEPDVLLVFEKGPFGTYALAESPVDEGVKQREGTKLIPVPNLVVPRVTAQLLRATRDVLDVLGGEVVGLYRKDVWP